MEFYSNLAFSLSLTLIIECLLFSFFYPKDNKKMILAVIINCLTNIPLNVIMYFVIPFGETTYFICLIILEIIVFIVEGLYYFKTIKITLKKGLFLSLILNGCSLFIGTIFQIIVSLLN